MMRRWGFQSTHLLSAGLCTGLALAGVCLPRPAAAQTVYMDEGGPGRFGPGGFDAVMPSDVMSSVRSTGLRPVSRPVLRGRRYVLHAIDTDGVPVRVVVNARTGRVMNVRAVGPDGGPPRWADRPMGPPQRADRGPPNRSYIDPETGERVYEDRVYREGERDYSAPPAAPGSRGPHVIYGTPDHNGIAAKPSATKKAEKVKLPPRKTAARTPEKDVKDVQKNAPESVKATTTQQPADTAHSDKPVKEETATKTSEPKVIEPKAAETAPEAKTVETKPDVKPAERQASQPSPDAVEHQTPSRAEAAKNADKAADKNVVSAKAVDVNAADAKAVDTKAADGKSPPKIDHALAERVNAEVVAKAKAEAKAQTDAKAGATSESKAGPDNNTANSKHKTDHETDGSGTSQGKAFPPVQDLE